MEQYNEEAIPFVLYNPATSKFEINEETREFLRGLDSPIGVISVAGMYRSGKSYLLNRVLLNRSRGFDVGHTINACTKGVWIWANPIEGFTPDGEPIKILVLDTEGLGATDEEQNHDVRIFSLAILLASYFIYNSQQSIDETKLNDLSLVINLTKNIQIKAGGGNEDTDPEEYASYFPSLMWVVRDFTLQLVDSEQEPITSKDYLEKALQNQKGFSEAIDKKNRIRRLLKSFFKERDCCTMIRPLTKEDQLQNLADIPLNNLRPEFVEQVHTLRRKVLHRIKPKQLNSKPLNGEMLFNLAKSYVDSINAGAVPSIESSWSYICKNECQKAVLDAYQIFEHQFYNEFQEKCPMVEQDLKQIYKTSKAEAMKSFEKQAVGEVKEEFYSQLKNQMLQKYELYSMENEKTSDQECQNFLQRNYNPIAQKLNSEEYETLEALNFEILGFLNYFMEEGPRGPNSQTIAQQFCYDRLSDGANYFNEVIKRGLIIQTQLAEQASQKLKSDLNEIKEEKRKELDGVQSKLRQAETTKAELAAREETMREQLAQVTQERERVELEAQEKINLTKKEAQRQMLEVQERSNSIMEKQKESSRLQKASESEYDKQKALYTQQIEHLTQKVKQQDEKEKQLIGELKEQKVENLNQTNEHKQKYEAEIRTLNQQVKDLSEQLFELESQNKDQEAQQQMAGQEWAKKETHFESELQKLSQIRDEITGQNKNLRKQLDEYLSAKNDEQQAENAKNSERIQELEEIVKELEEQNENMRSQALKDEAVSKQKLEFITLQLEQEQKQKEEMKQNHERILKSFRDTERQSVIGKEEAKNQIDELGLAHQEEIQQLNDTYMAQVQERENQLSQLTESLSKAELELTLSVEDFRKEIDNLREQLATAEEDRDKYASLSEKQHSQQQKLLEQTQEKLQEKIKEQEEQLEEKEQQLQDTINEIDSNSQAQLAELKKFYDSEKVRFEQRINDVKEQAARRLQETETDYKNQLAFLGDESEDIQNQLNDEVAQLHETLNQAVSQRDSQIALLSQQLESHEKQLADKCEQLDRATESHQIKLDQQYEMHNAERKELVEKSEVASNKIAALERAKITNENQIESLKSQCASKEKSLMEIRDEFDAERGDLGTKYAELKTKFEQKEDDLNHKTINFEKDQALMKQQIKFAEAKAGEMQTQYERTVQRYEDRIKIDKEEMQREIKDRSQRLVEEKEAAEAKYQAKRKELREIEKRLINKTSEAETEKAVLNQKFNTLEQEREKLIANYEGEIDKLRTVNDSLSKNFEDSKLVNASSYEHIRRELENSQTDLQEQKNLLDKERALWEGRFSFLESQRDQSKQDLEELQKKFQQSLELQQKMHFDNKSNAEMTHSQMLQQVEQKYSQRIKEQTERANVERSELSQKIKTLEREKSHLNERLELTSRDQMSEQNTFNKRFEKERELNERLQEELESIKSERDRKVMDLQAKMDKERENYNLRKREVENRAARAESKQTQLMLSHESEKATWDTKMTEMKHYIDELKSKNDRLQANLEAKEQQIGKLQQENKQARRNYMQATKNSDSSIGGALGGQLLNKLNLGGVSGTGSKMGGAGGYQPKMYGNTAGGGVAGSRSGMGGLVGVTGQANPNNPDSTADGATSERSFASRFGQAAQGNNNVPNPGVSASVDLSSNKFLQSSMAQGLKTNMLAAGGQGGIPFSGPDADTYSHRGGQTNYPNLMQTPQQDRQDRGGLLHSSDLDEADMPNTDEHSSPNQLP